MMMSRQGIAIGTGLILFGVLLLWGASQLAAPAALLPTLAAALAMLGGFHRLGGFSWR